jgi:hypothetical protein
MDAGMVQKYVGTSYDILKKIHDNLDFLEGDVGRQDFIMDQLFYRYTATGNQTAFNGVDTSGRLMAVPGSVPIVYINRIRKDDDTYTVSEDGTSVTFNSGVAADAIVQISSFAFNEDGTMYHSGVLSNVEIAKFETDIKALYDATVILEATATTKASEASTDRAAVAADLILTDADTVATAADVTSTNADVVTTNADAASTAQDAIDTANDLVATNQDTLDTAADLVLTNADAATTAQDALDTAADVTSTNADVVITNQDALDTAADVVTTNADAATTTQDAIDTAADAASTAQDATDTAANLVATNQDTIDTANDLVATNQDTLDTAADLVATAQDVIDTAASEAAAASSATEASTSESNAATSETNAAASFTNFNSRYLGGKAGDPTVDNDGDPLIEGTLYFNETDKAMFVYEGAEWVAAYASLSGAALSANNGSDFPNKATVRTNLGLGTVATTAATDYATAAQGATADSALQSSDIGAAVQAFDAVLDATTASYTTAEETKLSGIESGADLTGDGSTLTGLTSSQVGLGNLDNTSDANKPVSTAQQTAIDTAASAGMMLTGQTVSGSNGQIVYLSGANSWSRTDADAAYASSGKLGVRINSTTVLIGGVYITTGLTAASTYYLSGIAGAKTTTAPSGTGDIIRIIGYALSTTEFFFDPDKTYIEVT